MANPAVPAARLIETPDLALDPPRTLLRPAALERVHLRHEPHIVVVCGLAFEAQIAAGDGVIVVCAGEQRRLVASLRDAMTPSTVGVLSFGLAGGLMARLRPGDCIIGRGVLTSDDVIATDPSWSQSMVASLPHALHANLWGRDRPVLDPLEKHSIHASSGAVAVDIESHIAGQMARDRGIPFAVMRVVVDPSHRAVPHAAIACQRPDGAADVRVAIAGLMRQPRHVPAMLRLGVDAWTASRALLRCRRQLGHRFAFVDVAQHLLDVT